MTIQTYQVVCVPDSEYVTKSEVPRRIPWQLPTRLTFPTFHSSLRVKQSTLPYCSSTYHVIPRKSSFCLCPDLIQPTLPPIVVVRTSSYYFPYVPLFSCVIFIAGSGQKKRIAHWEAARRIQIFFQYYPTRFFPLIHFQKPHLQQHSGYTHPFRGQIFTRL